MLKSRFLFTLVFSLLIVCHAISSQIAIVYGVDSVQPSEQNFAKSLASHIKRWYENSGIETDLTDDANLSTKIADKKLAFLVYLDKPNSTQLNALRRFVSSGGKLVVFYSSSEALAQLMGVKINGYKKAKLDGQWSNMLFTENRPAGVPLSIKQTSPNILSVSPAVDTTRIMAWWANRTGKRTSDAAWLVSPSGYWMTHVMLADGDETSKTTLLLALAAKENQAIWTTAANHLVKQEITPLIESNLKTRLRVAPAASNRNKEIIERFRNLQKLETRTKNLIANSAGYSAYISAKELFTQAELLYGRTFFPRSGEKIYVWDHSGQGLYPGDWTRTFQELADSGVTDILVNIASAGFSHYSSKILPASGVFIRQGDQLTACIQAARPYGIRVHAWILAFSTEGATADTLSKLKQQKWTLQTEDGKELNWLDPANPNVKNYLKNIVLELAANYNVHGIHLDFIRYKDFQSSIGPRSKAAYEDFLQNKPNWTEIKSRTKNPERKKFMQWRADCVTDTVQLIRRSLKNIKPYMILSTAVYGKYPACIDSVGQDWQAWQRMGLVDLIMPMNYTEKNEAFSEWIKQQTYEPRLARQIIPGIGVTAAESRLRAVDVLGQINISRQARCSGFALFDLDETLRTQILPVLKQGISAKN